MILRLAFYAVALLSSTIRHVSAQSNYSLSSFDSNLITGLSPACYTVYKTEIPGCQASDFVAQNPCTATCIQSLQSTQTEAQAACAGNNLPANSMLQFFTSGQGVQQLCTTQKLIGSGSSPLNPSQTTMVTSTKPSSAPSSTGTASQLIKGGDTTVALPRGTVIAIIVAVAIAIVIFFLIAIAIYRKNYAS